MSTAQIRKAPSTLGAFLRSFRWGQVRQLDRVSRELLARAWAAGAGPGDAPFTIDLDSTICKTYGLDKEGARHHGCTGARGYHPLPGRRRPLPAGDGGTGSLQRGPGGNSRCGPTAASIPIAWSPSAASWTCASPSPSASTKACTISSRPYPRRTGRWFPTGWTAPPMWRRPPAPPSGRRVAGGGLA